MEDIHCSDDLSGEPSEDCLNLNVYVPPEREDVVEGNKSVMVWIHGGGLTVGIKHLLGFSNLNARSYKLDFFW